MDGDSILCDYALVRHYYDAYASMYQAQGNLTEAFTVGMRGAALYSQCPEGANHA